MSKIKNAMNEEPCCICGEFYFGKGNNAEPLAHGECCDECNKLVIIERYARSKNGKN